MDRVPISFEEKIAARYTRKGKGACWPWNGSVGTNRRPMVNLRDVIRFIYEKERGPIPPGMILKRTDHDRLCDWRAGICSHQVCVNPWHLEPRAPKFGPNWGLYRRTTSWPGDDTSHAAEYQRRGRSRRKGDNDDRHGHQKNLDDAADGDGPEGLCLAQSDLSQSVSSRRTGTDDSESERIP